LQVAVTTLVLGGIMVFLDIESLYTFEPVENCTETSDDETLHTQFEFGSESDTDDVGQGAYDAILPQIKSDPGNNIELGSIKSLVDDENQAVKEKNRIANNYKNFCSLCDFQAKKSYQLKIRIESKHEGILHSCDQCDYQAKKRDQVKLHQEVKHQGITHSCHQCDFKATYRADLKTHINAVHEGIKYSCNQCGFQSSYLKSLRSHQRIQHEGKRFPCDQCKYQAPRMDKLRRHKKCKHEGIRFDCKLCDYQGKNEMKLKSHRRAKHFGESGLPKSKCNSSQLIGHNVS